MTSLPVAGRLPDPALLRSLVIDRSSPVPLYYQVAPGDLARAVRAALEDRPRLGRMAAAAREHVLRHHTLERACERIVRVCLTGGSPVRSVGPGSGGVTARTAPA